MKRSLIGLAMLATACNSATTTPPVADAPESAPRVALAQQTTLAPRATAAAPAKRATPTPVTLATIPVGAKYSIFCDSFSGPDHVAVSTELRNLLVKDSRLHDWYIVHQEGQSVLYEGYYKEVNPSQPTLDNATRVDAQRARRERALVEAIPDPRAPDRKLFPRAQFYLLDSPDPDAPPAWNLTNAQGYWSVQVAAFTGYDRKKQAIEAVRQARAMVPPVEAYYYNGTPNDNVSIVCVGQWPAEAIKRQDKATASAGTDASETVVVDAGEDPMSADQVARMTHNDPNVKVLKAKLEIVDPTLRETLEAYPEHAVDGAVQMVSSQDAGGNPVMVPRPSMIVPIPHGQPAVAGAKNAIDDSEPTLLNPNNQSAGLGARLKGLGQ